MKFRRNSRGFGLAQVLVSAALLGILSVVFITLLNNAQKGQKNVQNQVDFDVLKSSILLVLIDPALCKAGLRNLANSAAAKFLGPTPVPAGDELGGIYVGSGAVVTKGQKFNGGLEVKKLELQELTPRTPDGFGNFTQEAKLVVELSKSAESFGGSAITNAANPFLLALRTDAAGTILECSSTNPVPRPPICNAPDKTLHWTGIQWDCATSAGVQACGAGNRGVVMYKKSGARFCCWRYYAVMTMAADGLYYDDVTQCDPM